MPFDAGYRIDYHSGWHGLPPLLFAALFFGSAANRFPRRASHHTRNKMRPNAQDGGSCQRRAHPIGACFDARHRNVRQPLIERPVVPEPRLAAANAPMPCCNRKRHAVVPAHSGTGVIRTRAAATHLVQAPSLARPIVIPRFDKLPRIKKWAPIALVVNALSVKHLRP